MTQLAAANKTTENATHPNFVGKDDRQFGAWTITTDAWSSQGGIIVLPINPESLEINQRIRANEVAMQGGKYFAVCRNPRSKSVFEFPSIGFKFNSGNIQPVFSTDYISEIQARDKIILKTGQVVAEPIKPSSGNAGNHIYGRYTRIQASSHSAIPGLYRAHKEVPVGVQNLYALIAMVQDSWMFEKTEPGFAEAKVKYSMLNRVIIQTSSLAFPSLTFYGFIDESGLQWEESAENFNNFEVSFNLIVTHTVPNLSKPNIEILVKEYKLGMYGSKAPRGVWTDYPQSVRTDADPESLELDASDVEASIDSAANLVASGLTGATDVAPTDPKDMTLADRIRSYVAKGVTSTAGTVDSYAEKAKIRFDQEYAAKQSRSNLAKSNANRFNQNKAITDSPTVNPATDAVIKVDYVPTT